VNISSQTRSGLYGCLFLIAGSVAPEASFGHRFVPGARHRLDAAAPLRSGAPLNSLQLLGNYTYFVVIFVVIMAVVTLDPKQRAPRQDEASEGVSLP
jgi:hypothetical protein